MVLTSWRDARGAAGENKPFCEVSDIWQLPQWQEVLIAEIGENKLIRRKVLGWKYVRKLFTKKLFRDGIPRGARSFSPAEIVRRFGTFYFLSNFVFTDR